ncbi:MAG: hypothetical protein AAF609_15480 [Cyanobacteria bacterium P01_C01_bin.120]
MYLHDFVDKAIAPQPAEVGSDRPFHLDCLNGESDLAAGTRSPRS